MAVLALSPHHSTIPSMTDTRRNRIFTQEQREIRTARAVQWNRDHAKRRAELRLLRLKKAKSKKK